jgi:hypothetical protein
MAAVYALISLILIAVTNDTVEQTMRNLARSWVTKMRTNFICNILS